MLITAAPLRATMSEKSGAIAVALVLIAGGLIKGIEAPARREVARPTPAPPITPAASSATAMQVLVRETVWIRAPARKMKNKPTM
jgi:hypothetical protein